MMSVFVHQRDDSGQTGAGPAWGTSGWGHWLTEVPTRRSEGHMFQPSLSPPRQAGEPTIGLIAAVS